MAAQSELPFLYFGDLKQRFDPACRTYEHNFDRYFSPDKALYLKVDKGDQN